MKKFLALLVMCTVFAVMLTACKNDKEPAKISSNPPADAVPVESIIVSTDDENGEGTKEKPYAVTVAQGTSIEIPYAVQPKNATDKSFQWSVEGTDGSGISFEDNDSKLVISVAKEGTAALVKGTAKDGSGVDVYIQVNVGAYNPVTDLTASGLMESNEEGVDYVLVTALGTKWDMSGGLLARGQELMDGEIFGGLQAPKNLIYYPNLQNMGFTVEPADATNPALLVSYSNEGVIRVESNGTWTALKAGETIVTVSSYTEPDVAIKIKAVVKDTLYAGILLEDYQNAPLAANSNWDLDADHATEKQLSRYGDWHLVMMHSNSVRGEESSDNN